jgi:hypothetical protein
MIIRNYPITTDNVRNVGGKDMILTRMVNHYSALSRIKPIVDTKAPHPPVKKTPHEKKGDLYRREQFHNVREAYKKVSNVHHYVDDKKPSTFNMKPKNVFKSIKEKYDDIEHLRTLKAMTKRILSIGKMHERRKNRYDPISNPTYFFMNALGKRDPKNETTKLISLKNLNEKYKMMNDAKRNKLLLGNEVYDAVEDIDVDNWVQKCNKNIQRPKSAIQKNKIEDNKNNYNYNTKVKGTNSTLVEYNPEKFMQIHKFNRENEGDKIIQRRKKKEEEKNKNNQNKNKSTASSINSSKSKSMTLKSKINNGMLLDQIPVYNYIEPNGENNSINQFHKDILQFIIENNVFRDEDFNILIEELIKKNSKNQNITRTLVERIVFEIKNDLENS